MLNINSDKKKFLSIYLWILTILLSYDFLSYNFSNDLYLVIFYTLLYNIIFSLVIYIIYSIVFKYIFNIKLKEVSLYSLTLFSATISFGFSNFLYINFISLFIFCFWIYLLYWLIISKNLNKKNILQVTLIILFILWLIILYSYIFEKEKLEIDRYNFEQLEKVKEIINNDKNFNNIEFYDLYKFNLVYNTTIKPIKNCYYITTTNYYKKYKWKSTYLFWFKLESLIYKIRYFNWYYVYPKYDLPIDNRCLWSKWCTDDINMNELIWTISNPCRD